MKSYICCLYDKKTKLYNEPQYYRTPEIARIVVDRQLKTEIENGRVDKDVVKEFQLKVIGEFDDESGLIDGYKPEDFIVNNFYVDNVEKSDVDG